MQTTSLVFGILSVAGMLIGFIPCLGALNWINIPLALIGLIISAVAYSKVPQGQSKGNATAGLIMCGIAIFFGLGRLILGGGLV